MEIRISLQDKIILRELAKKQLEYANMEVNAVRKEKWYQHNDLQGDWVPVHLDPWSLTHELLDPKMKCEGEFARKVERELRLNYMNQEMFDDDKVTPDRFFWHYDSWFKTYDMDWKSEAVEGYGNTEEAGLGVHFIPQIEDLEEDYHLIKPSSFGLDLKTTDKKLAVIRDAIGDILPVQMKMDCMGLLPTYTLVGLMGMENMLINMIDNPELFLKAMDQMAEDYLKFLRMLEENHMILPTTEYEYVGQATFAFTKELPDTGEVNGRHLLASDVWGYMNSQETVCISPEMFEELVFPCYEKIGSQFGLLSYGCCEPVDPIWDNCLSKLKNLRKVSISPWANEAVMGEKLRGTRVIYHRKPAANYLGVGVQMDEEALRTHIRETLQAARGCKLEITQRDVYSINNNPEKGRRYIQILREEIENNWKG